MVYLGGWGCSRDLLGELTEGPSWKELDYSVLSVFVLALSDNLEGI